MTLQSEGIKHKHLLKKPEDVLAWQIACALEKYAKHRHLIWFHVPNEARRSPRTGMLLKLMGMMPGAPDFVLVGPSRAALMEVKTERGRMSPAQLLFQDKCIRRNIPYLVVRSAEEAIMLARWVYEQQEEK